MRHGVFCVVLFCLILPASLRAQDTLNVMAYNLLRYPSSSNIATKNSHLSVINTYLTPDILGVVELDEDSTYADNILANTLNINGVTHYRRAYYSNLNGSSICNMLFYNSDKLGLKTQIPIPFPSLRQMDHYVLYYKSPCLAITQDTTFIHVIVAHLKAGSGESVVRGQMAQVLMDYLNNSPYMPADVMLMGDFNVYSHNEDAFQTMINYAANPAIRFYDPINQIGFWNNTAQYAPYHTQSTRLTSIGDGGATGGMDDRFDFILSSNSLLNHQNNVGYIPNSYKAVAQDGLHFNKSLTDPPTNTTVPTAVLNALYNMSDHLPVVLKLAIDADNLPTPVLSAVGSTSICAGNSITLNASNGSSYQWYKNGAPLSNSTSSLAASEAGAYYVTTGSGSCTRTSNSISVTVTPTPNPTISASDSTPASVCMGDVITYAVPLVAGDTYQWYVSGGTIIGSSTNNNVQVQWGNTPTNGSVWVEQTTP